MNTAGSRVESAWSRREAEQYMPP